MEARGKRVVYSQTQVSCLNALETRLRTSKARRISEGVAWRPRCARERAGGLRKKGACSSALPEREARVGPPSQLRFAGELLVNSRRLCRERARGAAAVRHEQLLSARHGLPAGWLQLQPARRGVRIHYSCTGFTIISTTYISKATQDVNGCSAAHVLV